MRYYFAPMEGLTDSIYRRLHHEFFPGITRYYTPFISPTVHRHLTPREQRELPPAESVGFPVVPQILTKNPEDCLWLARQCRDLGYREVNLNLGCPSGTVTAKGKGAGMLADPEGLDRFLEAVYTDAPLDISVKTRIGFTDPGEFPRLLEIYNRYPIRELTVHPRVRSVFYKGAVDMDAVQHAFDNSRAPVCFNGNLCSAAQIRMLQDRFPQVEAVMLGRGLIGDPAMLCPDSRTPAKLEQFHDTLLEAYTEAFGSARNAMFRMKENWCYMIRNFSDSDRLYKQLRKTTDLAQFKQITREIFRTCPLEKELAADW